MLLLDGWLRWWLVCCLVGWSCQLLNAQSRAFGGLVSDGVLSWTVLAVGRLRTLLGTWSVFGFGGGSVSVGRPSATRDNVFENGS